jgi:pimeloyl-ACP methyl ester carboxylesterase
MQTLAVDVQGKVIPDCGHWIAEEQPEMLLTKLKPFLEK